jgi:hypothetical protein
MIIRHRVNTLQELISVPSKFGAEIDLRLFEGELILAHDPFVSGERFEDWLESYRHKTLILNVKEDGLEGLITELLTKKGISDYFFLDQPFPTLRKSAIAGHSVAVRLSEFEAPIKSKGIDIKWAWLDSFVGDWEYLLQHAEWLVESKLNLCIVSPELQGRHNPEEPGLILEKLEEIELKPTAVCTKLPEMWEKLLQ